MKRHVPLILTVLSLACGNEPTSPTAPRLRRRNRPDWCHSGGIVVDPSGACIEDATVEVLAKPVLVGHKATQITPCDLTRFEGLHV